MRISKPFLRTVLFCAILVLAVLFLNFLLVPYSSMMKRFRGFREDEKKGNIDLLVIGSSQEFDGFDAELMSEKLNMHCAVFAPQGGNTETSYYCLVDAIGRNNIKTVIIGWDMLDNFEYPYNDYPSNRRAQMYREMLADSQNNPLLAKITWKNILEQRYTMTFFEYAAFPDNATQIKDVIQSRKLKKQPWIQTENTSTTAMDETDLHNPRYELDEVLARSYIAKVDDKKILYAEKIRDVCAEKGIVLYFISAPYPKIVQETVKNFSEMKDELKNIFEKIEIPLIDTYNETDFPNMTENSNYHDCNGHFIVSAKQIYTRSVCRWLKKS